MKFNVSLATGKAEDHEKLAQEIAKYIDTDGSEPEEGNPRTWISDAELQAFEREVGYTQKRWDAYADIMKRAALWVEKPVSKAFLMLAHFNGERRVENPNIALIEGLMYQSGELIKSLKKGPRKNRLDSLREYHMGIWFRRIGNYEGAMEQQARSKVKSFKEGNLVGASIANLCREVEYFNSKISTGTVMDEDCDNLRTAAHEVVKTCTGNNETEIRWRLSNAPLHVFLAHIWVGLPLTAEDETFWANLFFTELPKADEEFFVKQEPVAVAIKAGLAYFKNDRVGAYRFANKVITELQIDKQATMTARLILARVAAAEHLEVIIKDGDFMHQLRRNAKKIREGTATLFGEFKQVAAK